MFELRIKIKKGNSFRITIPMSIAKELKWEQDDILRLSLDKDKLILRKDRRLSRKVDL